MPYNHIYSYKKLRLTSNVGTLVLSCSNLSAVRSRIWYHKLRAQQLAGAAVENDSLKRPARATGRDKTKDKTLNALEAKRKAKDKKKRTSPKQRSSSAMDMEMSESDSEDGQISKVDQEDERLFGKLKSAAEPAVDMPLTSEHLQKIMLTCATRSRSIRRRPSSRRSSPAPGCATSLAPTRTTCRCTVSIRSRVCPSVCLCCSPS
ncbi:hypothetical protein FB451DRAFT_479875 [Mycena latifolia]|nr:hypothetical protein FB451DRAFT_479875 [Mycena latifolia]